MKEAMGSIGVSVATAPAVSGSIGLSISTPSFGEGGGSFMPKTSFGSIFKDTAPFSASSGSVREGPISNPKSIFNSSEWSAVARPPRTEPGDVGQAKPKPPAADTFFPSMKPFKAFDFGVNEGPARFNQKDFIAVATSPIISTETSLISKILDNSVASREIEQIGTKKAKEKTKAAQDSIRLERLAILFESVGLYDKKLSKEKAQKAAAPSIETKAQPKPQIKELRTEKQVLGEIENVSKSALKKDETEIKIKPVQNQDERGFIQIPKLVVDEKAQSSRKKTTKEIVAFAFKMSKALRLPFVSGREIALNLEEKREHKSKLLDQVDAPLFPDGSFHQAAAQIYELPKVDDLTDNGQWLMQKRTEEVLDKNRPVELAENDSSKRATANEAKRVLRFVEYFLAWI